MIPGPSLRRRTVLIGPFADDPTESVSAVNRAIVAGLGDRYAFAASRTNRRYGATVQARWSVVNFYYLGKHLLLWLWNLVRHRPDIAHYAINFGSALWKGLLFLRIARRFGAATVGHLHSGNFLEFWDTLSASSRRRAQAELSRLDALIVMSPRWRTNIAERLGIPLEKVRVLPNPIDPLFEARALALPITPERTTILAVGVLEQEKGILELIEAAGELRAAGLRFDLCVAGRERQAGIGDRVREAVNRHGVHDCVRLVGAIAGEQKIAAFAQAGILVLPSYFENLPLVLLEAAAAGAAIVATPVGTVPEFFADGESAVFIPPRDPRRLGEALRHLLTNALERQRLARNARSMFRTSFSRVEIMSNLDLIYASVLRRDGPTMVSTCRQNRL